MSDVGSGFIRQSGGAPVDRRYVLRRGYNQVVASLPASPQDGDQISFKQSTTATGALVNARWTFVYDAADAYWYPLGCTPLVADVAAAEATSSATYVNLTTTGPFLTIALAGDYTIEHGALVTVATANVGLASFQIGVTAAVDADCVDFAPVGGTEQASVSRSTTHLGIAANTTITAKYRDSGGGSATFEKRWMKITPLRVH